MNLFTKRKKNREEERKNRDSYSVYYNKFLSVG